MLSFSSEGHPSQEFPIAFIFEGFSTTKQFAKSLSNNQKVAAWAKDR